MDSIQCLDHGFVRLVDSMGGDLSVVRAARVSYDAAWRAGEDQGSDARLVNYLWKNAHTSPFEAVTFTFEVKAPIFLFRQWHRHRTWSYNELSARYRELPEEFYVPDPAKIGKQSESHKQMREFGAEADPATQEAAVFRIGTLIRIPVEEARRFECQNIASNDSEADSPSSTETPTATARSSGFTPGPPWG
jgi:thymidylate synthase (FAD)